MRLALGLALALSACSAPRWDRRFASWGSMREVMAQGRTQGRVELASAVHGRSTVGVGSLAGLQGEIAIVGGVAWISRVDGERLACERGTRPGDQATLLATAEVPAWRTQRVERDVTAAELAGWLAEIARQNGLEHTRAWPFVIEGELIGVDAHVLRGRCPFAGAVDAAHEPLRRSLPVVRGRLVGFFAPQAAGELVHHGQAAHVHVVVEFPELFVGHADAAGVRAGAQLLLPALD